MNPGVPAAAAAYKAANIENAPPLKLVRMLYEGALRFLEQAEVAQQSAQPARYQERCLRATAVIAELRLALDHAQAPQLAGDLDALYLFAEGEIRKAMLAESSALLGPARETLETLLDGWKRLEVSA